MARIKRVVVPGYPHHVTQRGNRRMRTFFEDGDYEVYIGLMAEWCRKKGVEVWAYCLMPNHVHIIAVPLEEESLSRAIGEAHRRYTRSINFRKGWRGHLWQERFASFVMDETHLLAAARYVEMNPVRANLCHSPDEYPWSSSVPHLRGKNDVLVKVEPLLAIVPDWRDFLSGGDDQQEIIRRHEKTGRPLMNDPTLRSLEYKLGRILRPQKRGPQPRGGRS